MFQAWRVLRRARRWRDVDIGYGPVRGDVKNVPIERLQTLMGQARDRSWSATGRPDWVSQRRDSLSHALLVVFGVESPSVYRCLAITYTTPGEAWTFTLDVSFQAFDSLEDISPEEQVRLLHSMLYRYPMLPLDPDAMKELRVGPRSA
jgi:hypothetical protein